MNQGYTTNMNQTYIPNQNTHPPYMNLNPYQVTSAVRQNGDDTSPEYAENVFRLNIGKNVTVYSSFPDSLEWRDRIFTGNILGEGKDYLLLKTDEGQIVMLWFIYINYAIFNDEISY